MSMLGFIYMLAASPTLLILSLFCFALAMWAQMKVKGAFNRAKRIRVQSGFSGAETAEEILRAFQILRFLSCDTCWPLRESVLLQ